MTAWSIFPSSENAADGGEIKTEGASLGGIECGVLCTSGGGCEARLSCSTEGCLELLSAARGPRALVTGRKTVPPFSMCYVVQLKDGTELQARKTHERACSCFARDGCSGDFAVSTSRGCCTTGPNKHLMIRSQTLKLPVGDVPDWEVDGSDSEHSDLKSPAERQEVIYRFMSLPA